MGSHQRVGRWSVHHSCLKPAFPVSLPPETFGTGRSSGSRRPWERAPSPSNWSTSTSPIKAEKHLKSSRNDLKRPANSIERIELALGTGRTVRTRVHHLAKGG